MTVYLGIDIASKKFDVAELCDGNYRCKAFENTSAGFLALYKWLGQSTMPDIHACLEATGDYCTSLATFLYKNKIKVSVVMRKLIHIVFGVLKSGTAFSSRIAVHSVVTSRPQ